MGSRVVRSGPWRGAEGDWREGRSGSDFVARIGPVASGAELT